VQSQRGVRPLEPIVVAIRRQLDGLTTSPLYARLLTVTLDDVERAGICGEVLAETPDDVEPVFDALPLRFLGAIHRLVLDGDAPDLAVFYPSAGGCFDAEDGACDPSAAFLATIDEHRDYVVAGLARSVQTNEVGRCASLLPGFLEVAAATGLPLRILELGTSAGLILRWDRYRYEGGAGDTTWGDASSALQFTNVYAEPRPFLGVEASVAERRGCDREPIDASTPEGRQRLRSFVWPDQLERFRALDAALTIAASHPVDLDRADAAEWVPSQLSEPREGMATVLYHSIVWQYLPRATRHAVKAALHAAGSRATRQAPLAWLRMEPGAQPALGADIRLTQWPSGEERAIARTGYHGAPVRLLTDGD